MKKPDFTAYLKDQIANDLYSLSAPVDELTAGSSENKPTSHQQADMLAERAHDLWISLRAIAVGAEKLPEDVTEIILVLSRAVELTSQSLQILATRARMKEIDFDA
jgi:hypothetical protein